MSKQRELEERVERLERLLGVANRRINIYMTCIQDIHAGVKRSMEVAEKRHREMIDEADEPTEERFKIVPYDFGPHESEDDLRDGLDAHCIIDTTANPSNKPAFLSYNDAECVLHWLRELSEGQGDE
jgi:hypothetical protein